MVATASTVAAAATTGEEKVVVLSESGRSSPKQPLTTSAPSGGGSNERSTKVLVGIVVVFLVCHVVRLVLQVNYLRAYLPNCMKYLGQNLFFVFDDYKIRTKFQKNV